MKKSVFTVIIFIFLIQFPLLAQGDQHFKSKIIQTSRLKMEYMDFEGEGAAIINIQGIHNFFDPSTGYEKSSEEWINFLQSFSDNYHVLAPIRRGYGKTEETVAGYDVASQAEDILSFMDALGIKRAFFIGRLIAAQEMVYLAEHHPNRILGLVFIDMNLLMYDLKNPEAYEFIKNNVALATDRTNPWEKLFPRYNYTPHIISDSNFKIRIPTLWFYNSFINQNRAELKWLDYVDYEAEKENGKQQLKTYFKNLATDSQRKLAIKKYLEQNNPNEKANKAIKNAFENLKFINEDDYSNLDYEELMREITIPYMKEFFTNYNK